MINSKEDDRLTVEDDWLKVEYDKLTVEDDKLTVEDDKLTVEEDKLTVKDDKLTVEGDRLFHAQDNFRKRSKDYSMADLELHKKKIGMMVKKLNTTRPSLFLYLSVYLSITMQSRWFRNLISSKNASFNIFKYLKSRRKQKTIKLKEVPTFLTEEPAGLPTQ